jgi:hypothetical protein
MHLLGEAGGTNAAGLNIAEAFNVYFIKNFA